MNEKIKKICSVIGTFFIGAVSALVGLLLHNRRATKHATNNDNNTKATIDNAVGTIDDCKQSIDNATKLNEELANGADEATRILQTIREKQQIKDV